MTIALNFLRTLPSYADFTRREVIRYFDSVLGNRDLDLDVSLINGRRRIYDALNCFLALDLIEETGEKKEFRLSRAFEQHFRLSDLLPLQAIETAESSVLPEQPFFPTTLAEECLGP